jgi:hypothetical protein
MATAVEVGMICCFDSTLDNPHRWTSWTVAATGARIGLLLRLTRMGDCWTAPDELSARHYARLLNCRSNNRAMRTNGRPISK